MTMINPMTPRLVELVGDIRAVVSDGDACGMAATHSTTIHTRQLLEHAANEIERLSHLMAEGGLVEPLGPLGPEVADALRDAMTVPDNSTAYPFYTWLEFCAARFGLIQRGELDRDADHQWLIDALYKAGNGYRAALLQANEVKRLSNPVDDGAVERALMAFYSSDSPAYEGDQKAAMRAALEAAEPHP